MGLSGLGYAAWALWQGFLAAAGSSAPTMPWWVVTGLMGWSRWFVLGIFVWLSAPVLAFGATLAAGTEERSTATYRELMGVVGFAVFVIPILSFAATLVVTTIKILLFQSWATEGAVLWAPDYCRNVLQMYLPWFVVGGGMIRSRGKSNQRLRHATRQRAPRAHGDEPLRVLVRALARQAARERFEREVAAERDTPPQVTLH